MKVRSSVKPICEKCKIIKRKASIRVICENPKTQTAPGLIPVVCETCGCSLIHPEGLFGLFV